MIERAKALITNKREKKADPETSVFRTSKRAFCILCDKPVDLVTFDKAVKVLRTSYPDVYKKAESRKLHRINNSRGVVMICSESFYSQFDMQKTQMLSPDLFITNPADSFV